MKGIEKISIFISLLLLSTLTFIRLGAAQPTRPTMKIEPLYYTGRAGITFDVNVYIYDAGVAGIDNTDAYAWQAFVVYDTALLDITIFDIAFGDFMEGPRVGPWGPLIYDAPAGQDNITVTDGSKFADPGVWGNLILIQDDYNSEYKNVTEQLGTTLYLDAPLDHSYTVAAGAAAYPLPEYTPSGSVTPGTVMAGQTQGGAPPGASGDGWLCTLTFTCKTTGTCTLDLDDSLYGQLTYIINSLTETLGNDPSGDGDPGYWQSELYKESAEFILPWDEDIDGDGGVNILDLASIGLKWGQTGSPGWILEDINDDGVINIYDLSADSTAFGTYANA